MAAGWIKIDRCITDAQGYFGEKFNRPMCWIDLILLAQTEPKELAIRGIKVSVERGQIATSVRELSYRWSLSAPTVMKRLNELANEGSIIVDKSNVVTIITIVNYESYIVQEQPKQPQQQCLFPELQETEPPKRKPPSAPPKHHHAPTVLLTDDEYCKLVNTYGKGGAAWMIQKLDDYKAAKGATYKSDYRAILNWVVKEYQKEQQYGNTSNFGQSGRQMARQQRDTDIANYLAGKLSGGSVQGDIQDK